MATESSPTFFRRAQGESRKGAEQAKELLAPTPEQLSKPHRARSDQIPWHRDVPVREEIRVSPS
jgi:hypothetical protein